MAEAILAAHPEALRHEVRFPPARPGHRMVGSGMIVINPPWGMLAEAERLTTLYARL
jgi:23S rRNA (adenine2030-N6)-methyltransferase